MLYIKVISSSFIKVALSIFFYDMPNLIHILCLKLSIVLKIMPAYSYH